MTGSDNWKSLLSCGFAEMENEKCKLSGKCFAEKISRIWYFLENTRVAEYDNWSRDDFAQKVKNLALTTFGGHLLHGRSSIE